MKAIELQNYGGSDALHLVDREKPKPGPGQILVQVGATSINPLDINRASGALKAFFPLEFPFVPGGDFSGTVAEVGEGVTDFTAGDEVFGNDDSGGGYAEFRVVGVNNAASKPSGLTDAEATSVAIVGLTAMQAIEAAQIEDGQTLLVTGMGGAIGSIIAQLLRDRDVKVIALAAQNDRERLLADGVDQVVERDDSFDELTGSVDAVIDAVGRDVQARSWATLKHGGTMVTLNQPPSQEEAERLGARATMLHTVTSRQNLDQLRNLVEAGTVKPRVGARYPLAEAGAAWANVASDRTKGKTVLETGAGVES